ncbi:MAG: Gfo/Idh/MocA family oxidoreductase [Candidatus Poribacteria bacterium]|nr:Gfo/Idh/MocA family oxidoreductase [Candidatus Poribacteria bacterium]
MNNRDGSLQVGIVGCGSFGGNTYARHVTDNPDARVVALCDVNRARAEAVARECVGEGNLEPRPAIYTDYRQMIDEESLDVVMVATMADVRPRITVDALNSGAHVLAAKPMAHSLAEAEEMLQAAEQANRLLMVGYNFRFREDAQAIHRFICSGGLGTPRFARAWSHAGGVPTWGPHYVKSRSGGGSLANTGVHVMDLAFWLLGSPSLLSVAGHASSRFADLPTLPPDLEAVQDDYDVEDLVSGYAHFADGITLSVESMWLAPPQIANQGVDLWGTKGYASLVPLRLLTWQDGDYVDVTETEAPGLAASFHDDPQRRTRSEVRHYIDCLLGRATPLITPHEMRTDQALVDGIYAGTATKLG